MFEDEVMYQFSANSNQKLLGGKYDDSLFLLSYNMESKIRKDTVVLCA